MKRLLAIAAKIVFVLGAAWLHAAPIGCLSFISMCFGPGALGFTARMVVFLLMLPLSAVAAVTPGTWHEYFTPSVFYVSCMAWGYLYLRILLHCFREDDLALAPHTSPPET